MQTTQSLLDLFKTFSHSLKGSNLPQQVVDFIELMSTAKYSTFLDEEKQKIYSELNIVAAINGMGDFNRSCKVSVLHFSRIKKYIANLPSFTDPQEDYV